MAKILSILGFFLLMSHFNQAFGQQSPVGATLLSDSDARTRKVLETRFTQSYGRLSEHAKQSLFLLSNLGTKPIAGYVVKWTVDQDDKPTIFIKRMMK